MNIDKEAKRLYSDAKNYKNQYKESIKTEDQLANCGFVFEHDIVYWRMVNMASYMYRTSITDKDKVFWKEFLKKDLDIYHSCR